MKIPLKYISLLIFSGLILIICYLKGPAIKPAAAYGKGALNKVATREKAEVETEFSFIKDIAGELIPILKSLNSL